MPIGVQKEAELKFMQNVANLVEKYQIPSSLVVTFYQSPSKHIQVSSNKTEKKGVTNNPITGTDDKRSITATLSMNLEGKVIDDMQRVFVECK